MRTFNIHEAKTHLSRLIEEAVKGEPFQIAKAGGKPLVKVEAIQNAPDTKPLRIGFLKGQFTVPDDIKTPFAAEIEEMFYGEED